MHLTDLGRPDQAVARAATSTRLTPSRPAVHLPPAADLRTQLDALLRLARAQGVKSEEIVEALREELEFEAELANRGRRLIAVLVDMGPPTANA